MTNLAAALFDNARQRNFTDMPVLLHDGGELSYDGLDRLSNQAANLLLATGAKAGDRILLLMRDTPELVALFLGAIKTGVIPMVLSTRISAQDLQHAADDSAAVLLYAEPGVVVLPDRFGSDDMRVIDATRLKRELAASDDAFAPLDHAPDEPAFWVCSSGSTSRPKSVVHTHGGVAAANGFHRDQLRVTAGTRVHCTSKLSFAYPLSNTLLAAMDVGASIVLYPDWHDPDSLLRLIRTYSPAVVFSTPTLYRRVLHTVSEAGCLTDVGVWVSAGEHLSSALNDAWRELTRRPILDCYGTSETLFLITTTVPAEVRPDSSGQAAGGVELALRDPEGKALAAGEIGELHVRHPFLAAGYANNPEQTVRRFNDGWFATGDLFLYDKDRFWYYRGREDSRIKIAGQWVHLQDIEDAVAEEGAVREVAAVSVPDEDGLDRVALFVVPETNLPQERVAASVQARLQSLPTHKRPRWLEFAEALPRTNTGKLKRHELRARVRQ